MSNILRIILLPISWLYGAGATFYHRQFDLGVRKSVSFEIPVIAIGNLSTGGTGKTPMAEYLISLLSPTFKTGVLSRGYRRITKGYLEVDRQISYAETGDEAMQIKRKFPGVMVAVCESRVIGLVNMVHHEPDLQVVILDDAFQHRAVKPGFSLLITDYAHLYTRDFLLPAGRLREPASGATRANAIVVSKCPLSLNENDRGSLIKELAPRSGQPVFFSTLQYNDPVDIFDNSKNWCLEAGDQVLLFCGIANPGSLIHYLRDKSTVVKLIRFNDHHPFTMKQLQHIQDQFSMMKGQKKVLLTTEKDAVRLLPFKEFIRSQQLEIYCIPVQAVFFAEDKKHFEEMITSFVQSFNPEDSEQSLIAKQPTE